MTPKRIAVDDARIEEHVMSGKKIVAFVFARGGSKGLPNKNIRKLGGVPLLGRSIQTAKACGMFERIIVSTDSEEIAQTARDYGAETPFMRPPELASDTASEWFAWQHAVNSLPPFEVFVSLPAVAPLRTPETVKSCVRLYLEGGADLVLTVTPAQKHPSFNMVFLDDDNGLRMALPLEKPLTRRQDAPPVYEITPVAYVAGTSFIRNGSGVLSGKTKAFVVPQIEGVDIDTPMDFEFAEFLHQKHYASAASS